MSIFADQILVHLHVATSLSAHYSSVKFITNIHMSFRTLYVMKAMCFRPSLLRAKMLQVHKIVCSRDYKLQIQWWHRKHSSIQLTSYTGYMLSVLHKIPGIPWLAERVSGHEHGLWPPLGPYDVPPPLGLGLLTVEVSKSHSDTRTSVGLLWMTDRSVAENSSRQTQDWEETDIHASLRDSNGQPQQASGRGRTP